ncbi:hypothetical protein OGAPHI_001537 [Ogataea philodendri]|uniref:Uncharacterized protein n=1 Tax=Ogataea philodendri TaxID=1378263 RepID=A0A9P8PCR8_9ASCO|nr:uncharacterized protein OGAPHI_001537 [Ogataea philodendri]KAH3669416.1 hypothetical protein OGAPHI_001537 [Ogataea philodendri]
MEVVSEGQPACNHPSVRKLHVNIVHQNQIPFRTELGSIKELVALALVGQSEQLLLVEPVLVNNNTVAVNYGNVLLVSGQLDLVRAQIAVSASHLELGDFCQVRDPQLLVDLLRVRTHTQSGHTVLVVRNTAQSWRLSGEKGLPREPKHSSSFSSVQGGPVNVTGGVLVRTHVQHLWLVVQINNRLLTRVLDQQVQQRVDVLGETLFWSILSSSQIEQDDSFGPSFGNILVFALLGACEIVVLVKQCFQVRESEPTTKNIPNGVWGYSVLGRNEGSSRNDRAILDDTKKLVLSTLLLNEYNARNTSNWPSFEVDLARAFSKSSSLAIGFTSATRWYDKVDSSEFEMTKPVEEMSHKDHSAMRVDRLLDRHLSTGKLVVEHVVWDTVQQRGLLGHLVDGCFWTQSVGVVDVHGDDGTAVGKVFHVLATEFDVVVSCQRAQRGVVPRRTVSAVPDDDPLFASGGHREVFDHGTFSGAELVQNLRIQQLCVVGCCFQKRFVSNILNRRASASARGKLALVNKLTAYNVAGGQSGIERLHPIRILVRSPIKVLVVDLVLELVVVGRVEVHGMIFCFSAVVQKRSISKPPCKGIHFCRIKGQNVGNYHRDRLRRKVGVVDPERLVKVACFRVDQGFGNEPSRVQFVHDLDHLRFFTRKRGGLVSGALEVLLVHVLERGGAKVVMDGQTSQFGFQCHLGRVIAFKWGRNAVLYAIKWVTCSPGGNKKKPIEKTSLFGIMGLSHAQLTQKDFFQGIVTQKFLLKSLIKLLLLYRSPFSSGSLSKFIPEYLRGLTPFESKTRDVICRSLFLSVPCGRAVASTWISWLFVELKLFCKTPASDILLTISLATSSGLVDCTVPVLDCFSRASSIAGCCNVNVSSFAVSVSAVGRSFAEVSYTNVSSESELFLSSTLMASCNFAAKNSAREDALLCTVVVEETVFVFRKFIRLELGPAFFALTASSETGPSITDLFDLRWVKNESDPPPTFVGLVFLFTSEELIWRVIVTGPFVVEFPDPIVGWLDIPVWLVGTLFPVLVPVELGII